MGLTWQQQLLWGTGFCLSCLPASISWSTISISCVCDSISPWLLCDVSQNQLLPESISTSCLYNLCLNQYHSSFCLNQYRYNFCVKFMPVLRNVLIFVGDDECDDGDRCLDSGKSGGASKGKKDRAERWKVKVKLNWKVKLGRTLKSESEIKLSTENWKWN